MKIKKPQLKKPPHLRKLNKADVKDLIRHRKRGEPDAKLDQAIENLPRITNETVAEHREELLSSARKYIYPLEHPKRRIITLSASILAAAIVVFFVYSTLALYKFQTTSTFMYRVTQVIPYPIAKAGPSYVAYENYLFELRHYMHYYETQQQLNFKTTAGQQQLAAFKKQALQQVIDDAYVKQLAAQNHVRVTSQEVNAQLAIVRQQNRLGTSNQELSDVLNEFWGWSIGDFRRELKTQLLAQKVVSQLDTATNARAQQVLQQVKSGADFGKLAQKYSDDKATKDNGGEYDFAISRSNRDVAPQVINALFELQPGQTSGIINAGYTLEIVKLLSVSNGKLRAAHISFDLKDINTYIKPLEQQHQPHKYLSVQ